jgi:hypothetical protein
MEELSFKKQLQHYLNAIAYATAYFPGRSDEEDSTKTAY